MNKRQLAALLKRMPWTGNLAHFAYRRVLQPWITTGVVGTIFNNKQQLLIVEHVFHPKDPWGLPGGWMGRNEAPEDTIRRELMEETGLHIDVLRLLLISTSPFMRNHLDIAYFCYAPQAEHIQLSAELLNYRWLEIDEIAQVPMVLFHQRAIQLALKEIPAVLPAKLSQEA